MVPGQKRPKQKLLTRPERPMGARVAPFPAPRPIVEGASKPGPATPEMARKQASKPKRRPSQGINTSPNVVQAPPIELPTSMRQETAPSVSGTNIGSPMMAEMARRQIAKRAENERLRNRVGAGALGIGTLGVLANMLGIGSNEEEEQMYQ